MLPIKKLYIDSRLKASDSRSSSDFVVDLPETLLMPENTVFYVDDVCIPVTWFNVDTNNNKLYVLFFPDNERIDAVIEIPEGNYNISSLATMLRRRMEEKLVQMGRSGFSINQSVDSTKNTFTLSPSNDGWSFKIYTNADLDDLNIYTKPYASINDTIGHSIPHSTVTFYSGLVDFHPIRNVYIHSPTLGSYNTLSLRGARDIIKKVPINSNYNELVFNSVMFGQDFLDCSRQTLSRLAFRLEDVYGNVVNLRGSHWSFSIVFAKFDTEP